MTSGCTKGRSKIWNISKQDEYSHLLTLTTSKRSNPPGGWASVYRFFFSRGFYGEDSDSSLSFCNRCWFPNMCYFSPTNSLTKTTKNGSTTIIVFLGTETSSTIRPSKSGTRCFFLSRSLVAFYLGRPHLLFYSFFQRFFFFREKAGGKLPETLLNSSEKYQVTQVSNSCKGLELRGDPMWLYERIL